MKNSSIFTIPLISLVLTGCVSHPDVNERLGQFTAASSFDIRNLNYEKSKNTATFVEGKTCYKVNAQTLIYESGPQDNLIQRAMDEAIRAGQKEGLDGDLLVNARIERKTEHREGANIFIKDRFECIFVSGDLVRIKA